MNSTAVSIVTSFGLHEGQHQTYALFRTYEKTHKSSITSGKRSFPLSIVITKFVKSVKIRCSVSTHQNILAFPRPLDRLNMLVSYIAVEQGLRCAIYTKKKYFLFCLHSSFTNIPVL
jgi:hypothetical protein